MRLIAKLLLYCDTKYKSHTNPINHNVVTQREYQNSLSVKLDTPTIKLIIPTSHDHKFRKMELFFVPRNTIKACNKLLVIMSRIPLITAHK